MSNWAKEEVWVARNEHGEIVRASDISPADMLQQAEELRVKANEMESSKS